MSFKDYLGRLGKSGGTFLDDLFQIDQQTGQDRTYPISQATQLVAVHEAGHLITAWFCTYVVSISHVTIEHDITHDRDGYFSGRLDTQRTDSVWAETVIKLGGIAAEGIVFNTFRTNGSQSDLAEARNSAQRIENLGPRIAVDIPWKSARDVSTLDIGKMFETTPSPITRGVLNTCYRHARHVIKSHHHAFDRLVDAILRHRTLTKDKLEQILGPRLVYTFLPRARPIFLLPT